MYVDGVSDALALSQQIVCVTIVGIQPTDKDEEQQLFEGPATFMESGWSKGSVRQVVEISRASFAGSPS